jgi:purine-binding chemotaxis protein CheW
MNIRQKKTDLQLAEPDQVVAEYLQTLLSDVEEYQEPVKEVVVAPVIQKQAAVEVEKTTDEPKVEQIVTPVQLATVDPEDGGKPQPVVPHWAQERFQCLLFEVSGLHLAVPLSELNSIAGKQEVSTTRLLGQPEWHRGIFEHRGLKVGVVDVARLVMPGELSSVTELTVSPNHVLIIGEGEWGLMCDKLLSPIMVERDEIHWSCRHENRAWNAGTLPDQLCIILDLDVLLAMIGATKSASMPKERHE